MNQDKEFTIVTQRNKAGFLYLTIFDEQRNVVREFNYFSNPNYVDMWLNWHIKTEFKGYNVKIVYASK